MTNFFSVLLSKIKYLFDKYQNGSAWLYLIFHYSNGWFLWHFYPNCVDFLYIIDKAFMIPLYMYTWAKAKKCLMSEIIFKCNEQSEQIAWNVQNDNIKQCHTHICSAVKCEIHIDIAATAAVIMQYYSTEYTPRSVYHTCFFYCKILQFLKYVKFSKTNIPFPAAVIHYFIITTCFRNKMLMIL